MAAPIIVLFVLLILIIVAILVFEVVMFIDTIKNKFITTERKLLWLLGMLLIHPFIALIYYFTDHKRLS